MFIPSEGLGILKDLSLGFVEEQIIAGISPIIPPAVRVVIKVPVPAPRSQ